MQTILMENVKELRSAKELLMQLLEAHQQTALKQFRASLALGIGGIIVALFVADPALWRKAFCCRSTPPPAGTQ